MLSAAEGIHDFGNILIEQLRNKSVPTKINLSSLIVKSRIQKTSFVGRDNWTKTNCIVK